MRFLVVPAFVLLLAGGCDSQRPLEVLERRCADVTANAALELGIVPPATGELLVLVEPRGIAVTANTVSAGTPSAAAASPVDRLGAVSVLRRVRKSEPVVLTVSSRDWPRMRGVVCVEAQLLHRADLLRRRAERAFASGGHAVHAREWQAAFDGYERAARDFARLREPGRAAAALHSMGELAYMRLGREADAVQFARQARSLDHAARDVVLEGARLALEARASAELVDGADASGIAHVRRTLAAARNALARQPAGVRELLRLKLLEGYLAYRTASPEEAQKIFRIAMERCAAAADWECHAGAAQNVALLAEESESYELALAAYEDSLRHLDVDIAPELTADIWDNLGRLQRAVGLVGRSEDAHVMAFQLYGGLRNCDGARRALARLGALHAQVGSVEDAVLELERAASLECEELLGIARERRDASRTADATATPCRKLIDPSALSGDGRNAALQAVLSLGQTLLLADDVDGAERCLAQASRYASTARGRIRSANALGELLLTRQRHDDARRRYVAAQQLADESGIPAGNEHRTRTHLGLAQASMAAGDWQQARALALRALLGSSERADFPQTVEALRALARTARLAGDATLAARTLHVALELIERVPIDELNGEVRALYLAAQHGAYAELVFLLASEARTERDLWNALLTAERGRARSLRYALTQAADRGEAGTSARDRVELRALLQRISAAAREPQDAAQRVAALASARATERAPLEEGRLRDELGRLGATLVQYVGAGEELLAFVVDARRITMVRLGERDTVASLSLQLVEQLRAREADAAGVRRAAASLARRVWWPLAGRIATARVILAPEDALHVVPFAVLPWSETAEHDLLVDRVEIAIAPSSAFLAREAPDRETLPGVRLTLLGDPFFRSEQWRVRCSAARDAAVAPLPARPTAWTEWLPSLPGSRAEVLGIAAMAGEARPAAAIVTLLGCEATADRLRDAVRKPGNVLHVATHGRVDARRPRLSALAMTPDAHAPRDASFSLLDILGLDLELDLVTLSSCETSRGRLLTGEGVLGPAQAFLQAGAASVVATFWLVEDAATADFMRGFYSRLLNEAMPAAAALRETQRRSRQSGQPFSWAAFALHGRPDTRI